MNEEVKDALGEGYDIIVELMEMIKDIKDNRPSVFQTASPYNAVLGTPNDGKSGALAIQLIREFLL